MVTEAQYYEWAKLKTKQILFAHHLSQLLKKWQLNKELSTEEEEFIKRFKHLTPNQISS